MAQERKSGDFMFQVLRLSVDGDTITGMLEVLADDGHMLSASSSAIYWNQHIVVGTVSSNLLYCEVRYL